MPTSTLHNFAPLQRVIDAAEMLNYDEASADDLTTEQRLIAYKTFFRSIKTAINNGIEERKDELNLFISTVQNSLNTLDDRLLALAGIDGNTLDDISKIKTLLEGDAVASILGGIDAALVELNERKATEPFPAVVNNDSGVAIVDISPLGLPDTASYSVSVTQDATSDFAAIEYAPKKVDKDTIHIVTRPLGRTPEQIERLGSVYDGTITAARFTALVTYQRPEISIEVVETDNDTRELGGNDSAA